MPAQCGALFQQLSFILPEILSIFFHIYKSAQHSSCMTRLFFINILSTTEDSRTDHALQRKEELTLQYWRVLIIWVFLLCTSAHFYNSKSRLGQRAGRRSGAPSSLPHQSHTSDTAGVLSFVVKNIVNTNDHWKKSNICPQKLHTSGRAP